MNTTLQRFPSETKEQAVEMYYRVRNNFPSDWAAMQAVAAEFDCSAESVRLWLKRAPGAARKAVTLRVTQERKYDDITQKLIAENKRLNKLVDVLWELAKAS